MKMALYGIMFVSLGAMFWLAYEHRMKGDAKTKIAAICVSLIALLAAVTTLSMDFWLPKIEFQKYRERHMRTQYVAYKMFGQKIAELHTGSKILLVDYDTVYFDGLPDGAAAESLTTPMKGFEDGLANKAEITQLIKVLADAEAYYEEPESNKYKPRALFYSNKVLNAILDKYNDCDVIVLFVGLPYDHEKEFKLWTMKDAEKRPKLVLLNSNPGSMKKAIKRDFVSLMMVEKNVQIDLDTSLPESDQELFDSRYLLITKDNVDEMSDSYPKLFYP